MDDVKLYMLLLGATVPGRRTEQHDIFFGIGATLRELVPAIVASWPEAAKIHIDAWREVTVVDGYAINIVPKGEMENKSLHKIFFINLGGYKKDEFDEFHYKMLAVADDKGKAIQHARKTAFYKHMGFDKANSHIDDKYGIDVDDIYAIEDILSETVKQQYSIQVLPSTTEKADDIQLGYFKLDSL
jgi:hypothetical protein